MSGKNDISDSSSPVDLSLTAILKETADKLNFINSELTKFLLFPVRRKLLVYIHERLRTLHSELEASSGNEEGLPKDALDQVHNALGFVGKNLCERTCWDAADAVKAVIPVVARDETLYRLLVMENRANKDVPSPWEKRYPEEVITKLLDDYDDVSRTFKNDGFSHRASQCLRALYDERNDEIRHDRTTQRLKVLYLTSLSFFLLLPLVIALFVKKLPGGSDLLEPWGMLAVVIAGGLGAVLSRALKLRGLERITELKGVWSTMFPQVVMGMVFAAIATLILQTGVVTIGTLNFSETDNDILKFLVVGLVAGFSEPFTLGLLEKVGAVSENQKND